MEISISNSFYTFIFKLGFYDYFKEKITALLIEDAKMTNHSELPIIYRKKTHNRNETV